MRPKVNRRRKPKANKKRDSKSAAMTFKGAMRILGIALVFGGSLYALTWGVEKLGRLSAFEVREIRWAGLRHLKAEKMEAQFQSVLGQNLFRVDIEAVHRRLSAHQWIKSATVKKDFPDKLLVIVVERKPASVEYEYSNQLGTLVDFSTDPYLIDQEGVTLQQGGPFPPDLPRMLNINPQSYDAALSIGHLVQTRLGAYIDLSDPEDLRVFFTDVSDGHPVGLLHLGRDHLQEKWRQFLRIEGDLEKRGFSTWEIDLHFPGKAIVKKGGIPRAPEMFYF
ncbi:MAG: cell division protein FtsQ/DivIB [Nitrospiria bacterium]